MQNSVDNEPIFHSVLNSLPQQLCVIDETGVIQWVNDAWVKFAEENGGGEAAVGLGTNYLEICSDPSVEADAAASEAYAGIRGVLDGESPHYRFEYPCHSPTARRWFMMEIRPLNLAGGQYFVVSHHDITGRKEAEENVRELAIIDGLTGISNRRCFDDFFLDEWRRAQRVQVPVSLALIDIDSFKQFNDNYGHIAGDECLKKVAAALREFARRPGDLVARYGGEEFAIVMGETDLESAETIAEQIRAAIYDLNIVHEFAQADSRLTASLGVAMAYPHESLSEKQLLEAADHALFASKRAGRNRVSVNRSLVPTLVDVATG